MDIVVHIVSLYQRIEITVKLIWSHSLLVIILLIIVPSVFHIVAIVIPNLLRIPSANRKERASALVARLDEHFPHPAILKITIHLLLLIVRCKVGLVRCHRLLAATHASVLLELLLICLLTLSLSLRIVSVVLTHLSLKLLLLLLMTVSTVLLLATYSATTHVPTILLLLLLLLVLLPLTSHVWVVFVVHDLLLILVLHHVAVHALLLLLLLLRLVLIESLLAGLWNIAFVPVALSEVASTSAVTEHGILQRVLLIIGFWQLNRIWIEEG